SGKITKIFFEEGSNVSKGQLLLTLNDAELQAQLKRGLIQKEFLEKRKARNEKLKERDGISEEEFELLNAELNRQVAENEAIKSRIEQTKLVAPFSGRIGLRYVSEGSYINPATKVADLIDISTIKLNFAVPEKYMGLVKKGTKVKFAVASNAKAYEGTVYAIEPKIDASTRTIQVRAISNNKDSEIFPGAFANISIVLNKIEKAHLIPTEALIPELNQMKVFVVKNGKAENVNVITGTRTENKIQILDGLSLGDTVITSGILQIRTGSNVKIAEVE
nr:efflux RND transporter periplasmic adaptor subunit [Thermoflexibacter sp.]